MKKDGGYKISNDGVCDYGYKREMMNCIDSFTWCQPDNGLPAGEPVPPTAPKLENPEPRFDDDGNGRVCTDEVKSCGDGTYVGRTGPRCEFAKCPGKKPAEDF